MKIEKTHQGYLLSDKVVTSLDRFVLDMVQIIQRHTPYVIISGYVAILLGRSRGTEDAVYLWEIGHDILDPDLFNQFCKDLRVQPEEYGISD